MVAEGGTTAQDSGFGTEEAASKLMEMSAKAKENGPRYAALIAQNAVAAVEGNAGKQGRAREPC